MQVTEKSTIREYFQENGYAIIDTDIDHAVLDNAVAGLSPYFGDERVEPEGVSYADPGRIQDAWFIENSVWKIATSKSVLAALKDIYGLEAEPFQTLNFYKGTGQPTHSDSIHFNCEPFGNMCGVWVALEDIGPDQGPLRIYPKSQELEEMNYPDFGLEPGYDQYPQYLNAIENLIEKNGYEERRAIIKKGQAVIWAANVLHGGSPQNDISLTRKSQVTHYYVGKPKAWRPSESTNGRAYFVPETLGDCTAPGFRAHPGPSIVTRVAGRARRLRDHARVVAKGVLNKLGR